jgi:glycosyltransferase involved in cell wall biosynthesis
VSEQPTGNKTVAMMVWNTCENDSRVTKEATTLAAGYDITVVCLSAPDLPDTEERDGVTYRRVPEALGWVRIYLKRLLTWLRSLFARGSRAPSEATPGTGSGFSTGLIAGLYRLLTFRLAHPTMGRTVRELQPAVVHAHDLQVLPAAAKVKRRTGCALIYDSHELATDLSMRPPKLLKWMMMRTERRAIKKADRVITVSPGIAEHLTDTYGIPLPGLIYNCPPVSVPSTIERTVRGDAGLSPETPLVLFVGGLAAGRGLEETVDAIGLLPDHHLVCVGPRRPEWEATMHERAQQTQSQDRVHFLDPVPIEDLLPYIGDATVGIVPIQDISLSYRYTMPNKLFEMVLAGLPVVVSDLPHLREFVESYGVGLVADETDPAALAKAIQEVGATEALRPRGPRLDRIKDEFSWEAQGRRLAAIYSELT